MRDVNTVIFDLDDTLYSEFDFVKSGYQAVANFVAKQYSIDERSTFNKLLDVSEKNGRGKVFDIFLKEMDMCSEEEIQILLYVYRSHTPNISVFSGVYDLLTELRKSNKKIGLITDGMASIQRKKFLSLGLNGFFDVEIFTGELSDKFSKPSEVPFRIICKMMNTSFQNACYVADNPTKDFHASKNLGMRSIRIRHEGQRRFVNEENKQVVEANKVCESVLDIRSILL